MRSLITTTLAAAVAGALALGPAQMASAQDQGGDHGGNDPARACMRDARDKILTADQKEQLKKAHESGADMREAMGKILTDEQKAKLKEARDACHKG
jgi:Spy/CpxP family protein refolding chaperone